MTNPTENDAATAVTWTDEAMVHTRDGWRSTFQSHTWAARVDFAGPEERDDVPNSVIIMWPSGAQAHLEERPPDHRALAYARANRSHEDVLEYGTLVLVDAGEGATPT